MNAPNNINPKPAPFKLTTSRGVKVEPPRVVIHGAPGIGKSTLASCAPAPVFVDLEHGTLQLDVSRVDGVDSWETLLAALRALAAEPHEFKTVVIDTLDKAEWLCWQHLCRRERVDSIEKVGRGFGKGYIAAYEEFRALARALDDLREKRGMAVIVIAHSKIENAPDAAGDEHQRWTLKVHKQVAGLFYEGFDAILFARLEVFTTKTDTGKVKGFGDARVLETAPSPAWLAKNRYRLPARVPLAWDELHAGINRGAAEVEGSIRAEIDAALSRLSALDTAAADKARAALSTTQGAAALGNLLNRINAGVAQREAARGDDTQS